MWEKLKQDVDGDKVADKAGVEITDATGDRKSNAVGGVGRGAGSEKGEGGSGSGGFSFGFNFS